jgi:hypothetical protein
LADFTQEIQRVWDEKADNKLIEELRKRSTDLKWAQKLSADEFEDDFGIDSHHFNGVDYGLYESFKLAGKVLNVKVNAIFLGSEGKFSMEESDCTLRFMETCAQRAFAQYKMAPAFRVWVF